MFHFHNFFQNLTFQGHPKALVWNKGLKNNLTHMQKVLKPY